MFWQRPTLPERFHSSTISTERLNFCVRYGYRCFPLVLVTKYFFLFSFYFLTLFPENFEEESLGQALDLLVSLSLKYYYSST